MLPGPLGSRDILLQTRARAILPATVAHSFKRTFHEL